MIQHHHFVVPDEAGDVFSIHNILENLYAFGTAVNEIAENIKVIVLRKANVVKHFDIKIILAMQI
jgi:hypothetical protein